MEELVDAGVRGSPMTKGKGMDWWEWARGIVLDGDTMGCIAERSGEGKDERGDCHMAGVTKATSTHGDWERK